jgi:hypothetical protein
LDQGKFYRIRMYDFVGLFEYCLVLPYESKFRKINKHYTSGEKRRWQWQCGGLVYQVQSERKAEIDSSDTTRTKLFSTVVGIVTSKQTLEGKSEC